MDHQLADREARLPMSGSDRTACLKHFNSDGAGPIIFDCHGVEICYELLVFAFA